MKKISMLLVLTMTSIIGFSQKTVKIQVAYIPDHKYIMETKNLTKMVMDAKVDDATREQMKASGMNFPLTMDMDQSVVLLMTTGNLNENKGQKQKATHCCGAQCTFNRRRLWASRIIRSKR